MKRCNAYCVAKDFDFTLLKELLTKKYKSSLIRDVIQIREDEQIAHIFSYGVVVLWNFSFDDEKRLLDEMSAFEIGSYESVISDDFSYTYTKEEIAKVSEDHISLSGETDFEKLAISHAIAQSLKLTYYEEFIIKTIENTRHIPENLAKRGKTELSRKQLAKERGRLYLAKSNINLHYDLLDTPEFFWDYPELEPYYQIMATYLDLKPRIEVLNKKLEVIHELFEMLADEQNHKHSSLLEVIIIWLIVFEVFISIFHDILGLF